jgi:amino acid permease
MDKKTLLHVQFYRVVSSLSTSYLCSPIFVALWFIYKLKYDK